MAVFENLLVVEYKGVTTNAVTPVYFEILQHPQPQHSFTHILCLSSYATDRAEKYVLLQNQCSLKTVQFK